MKSARLALLTVSISGLAGNALAAEGDQGLIDAVIGAADSEGLCADSWGPDTDPELVAMFREQARETSEVFATSDGAKVVRLTCFLGAYQGASEFVRVENEFNRYYSVHRLQVEYFDGTAVASDRQLTGFGSFDAATDTLVTVAVGRGIGDYGTRYVHKIDTDADKLVLVEQRQRDEPLSDEELQAIEEGRAEFPDPAVAWPVVYPR